jgi:hypothetical protein
VKVEFTVDEVNEMLAAVIDKIVELEVGRTDRAAIRRWRTETSPGSAQMQLLTEKANTELRREHERSVVSPIKKPDWAS